MSEDDVRANRNRNEVFSNVSAGGIPHRNVMSEDFGYEVPVENVPLPSMGAVYPVDGPLHGQETIQVRAMTAADEDILTSRALVKKGTVITELIRSCAINKDIHPDQMLSGDRNAILVSIRITGYGAEYSVEIECPECDHKAAQDFNLAALKIKRLGLEPMAAGSNVFEATLPMTKKNVKFKFLTGTDEREMMVIADRKKKQGHHAEALITERLSHQILSIDGITDKNKIRHFIRNMPARDSLFLRKHIDKHEPGIDMKTWMECPACAEQSEVRLPMGAAFFWPDTE